MKETNEPNLGKNLEGETKPTELNNNLKKINKASNQQLKRVKSMNQYINITLDNMGFTRYHLLLFITNALFLFF